MKKLRDRKVNNLLKVTSNKRQLQGVNVGNLVVENGLPKTQITLPLSLTKDLSQVFVYLLLE